MRLPPGFGSGTWLVALGVLFAAACSSQTIVTAAPPAADAGASADDAAPPPDDTADAGADDAAPDTADPLDPNYPTTHPPFPLVDFHTGGRVLESPKIVTVTFGADPLRARLEQLGDTITSTPWWDAVRDGYCAPQGSTHCVGRGTGGGHVNITDATATSYTDSAQGGAATLQDYIKSKILDHTLPAPTSETLYVFYLASGVSVSLDSAGSCHDFGAYHNTLSLAVDDAGTPTPVAYALVPRCAADEATTTISATHEMIEAATDPDVGLNSVAYYMDNQLWAFAGGEVADLCVDFLGGDDTYDESGFVVQRSWSNGAAKASHDPCVPAPKGQPYFNAALTAGQDQLTLAVGDTGTVEITAFSDGPMSDWDLSILDYDKLTTGTSHLAMSLDKSTVHNGSKITLTVKLLSAPTNGYAPYAIRSQRGNVSHVWPGVVLKK